MFINILKDTVTSHFYLYIYKSNTSCGAYIHTAYSFIVIFTRNRVLNKFVCKSEILQFINIFMKSCRSSLYALGLCIMYQTRFFRTRNGYLNKTRLVSTRVSSKLHYNYF